MNPGGSTQVNEDMKLKINIWTSFASRPLIVMETLEVSAGSASDRSLFVLSSFYFCPSSDVFVFLSIRPPLVSQLSSLFDLRRGEKHLINP